MESLTTVGFFPVVWSTWFDAALAYVVFCLTCDVAWHLVPNSYQQPFSLITGARRLSGTAQIESML